MDAPQNEQTSSTLTHFGLTHALSLFASTLQPPIDRDVGLYALGIRIQSFIGLVIVRDDVPKAYVGARIGALIADGLEQLLPIQTSLDQIAGTHNRPAFVPFNGADGKAVQRLARPYEAAMTLLAKLFPEWVSTLLSRPLLGIIHSDVVDFASYKVRAGLLPDSWISEVRVISKLVFPRASERLIGKQDGVLAEDEGLLGEHPDAHTPVEKTNDGGVTEDKVQDESKPNEPLDNRVALAESRRSGLSDLADLEGWALLLQPRVLFVTDEELVRYSSPFYVNSFVFDKVIAASNVRGIDLRVCSNGVVVAVATQSDDAFGPLALFSALLAHAGVRQVVPRPTELVWFRGEDEVRYRGHFWSVWGLFDRVAGSGSVVSGRSSEAFYALTPELASQILTFMSDIDRDIGARTIRFGQADALLLHGYWTESFLVAWAILEDHLRSQCSKMFQDKGYSESVVKNRIVKGNWGVSQYIDVLFASGAIDLDCANEIHGLRKKRNDIVHDATVIGEDVARQCLRITYRLVPLPNISGVSPPIPILPVQL